MKRRAIVFRLIVLLTVYYSAVLAQNRHFEINFTVPTYAQTVLENKDQGLIFGGFIQPSSTQLVAFIACLDKNGQWKWGKQVKEAERYTDFSRLIKLSDGHYLAGGNIAENAPNPPSRILLTKFNEQGDILWNKSIGVNTSGFEIKFIDFIERNKNIIILGQSNERITDGVLLMMNINGTDADDKVVSFGGDAMEDPQNILSDGVNFMVSGATSNAELDNTDVFLSTFKADLSLDKTMVLSTPGIQHTSAFYYQQGQYYLGVENNNPPFVQLVKLDPSFKVSWAVKFETFYLRGIGGVDKSILVMDGTGGFYKLDENGTLIRGLSYYTSGSINLFGYALSGSGYSALAGLKSTTGPIVLIHQNADLQTNCEAYNYSPVTSKVMATLTPLSWQVNTKLKSTIANAKNTWTSLTLKGAAKCNTTAVEEEVTVIPHLFPNPFSDLITVGVPASWRPGQVRMFNLQGQLVQQVQVFSGETVTLGQSLPPGVYFLNVSGRQFNSTVKVQKSGR